MSQERINCKTHPADYDIPLEMDSGPRPVIYYPTYPLRTMKHGSFDGSGFIDIPNQPLDPHVLVKVTRPLVNPLPRSSFISGGVGMEEWVNQETGQVTDRHYVNFCRIDPASNRLLAWYFVGLPPEEREDEVKMFFSKLPEAVIQPGERIVLRSEEKDLFEVFPRGECEYPGFFHDIEEREDEWQGSLPHRLFKDATRQWRFEYMSAELEFSEDVPTIERHAYIISGLKFSRRDVSKLSKRRMYPLGADGVPEDSVVRKFGDPYIRVAWNMSESKDIPAFF